MKRIAILGCENSHANAFLTFIQKMEEFRDIEVVGVYSDEPQAAEKLQEQFSVPVMKQPFSFAKRMCSRTSGVIRSPGATIGMPGG